MNRSLQFAEITDINDPLLLPWLDLYEAAFPPEEKALVSVFLTLLKAKAKGLKENSHMLAALDSTGDLAGLMRFDANPQTRIAYFWYLAVITTMRNSGIGAACFTEVLRRASEANCRALVLEVEIPDQSPDHAIAERRIGFYRRYGARLLTGIRYTHKAGPHQPEILMHIMVRPLEPITAQEAFDMARELFDDGVAQIGELGLK